MAGLMELLEQMQMQQGGMPPAQVDNFGIEMRPPNGSPVPPAPPPVGQHIGNVMGQQPMMDPNMMQMLMQMFGQGAGGK